MRLDKYLKLTGLIKRRPIAKEMCDAGRVVLNERAAKASSEVRPGDLLEIHWQHRLLKARVLEVPARAVSRTQADSLYEIIADERLRQITDSWWTLNDES